LNVFVPLASARELGIPNTIPLAPQMFARAEEVIE
jgi:hypothetical protein